ncbi:MAG: histidine phosphatase family protein [Alphaproteobacteria bacterium]|nr:histidine phosphatase family protein [Alphaproteobacteria bacterium]
MTRLILARHGNTFGPGDTPVWVGARSDLPLVEKGVAQARALGEALKQAHIVPDFIWAGPLQRTREAARIAAEIAGFDPTRINIETRLAEIDYGAWEGKTNAGIEAAGGGAELAAWDEQSIYPATPGWQPAEAQIIADVVSLLDEARGKAGLVVTSNGILRFFARAAHNAGNFPGHKVATGHVCIMDYVNGKWCILSWNAAPEIAFSVA